MIRRILTVTALMLAVVNVALAQQATKSPEIPPEVMKQIGKPPTVIPAPVEPDSIPLYGAKTPGSTHTESWTQEPDGVLVRNVTRPTLAPILPKPGKATGAAVVVAPGGGFTSLAAFKEGYEVARALADRGIAAFVLKYRLVPTPADESEARLFSIRRVITAVSNPASGGEALRNPESTEDGLAALQLVRSNAATWGIDPARVGIIGFSAGAMTSLATGLAPRAEARPAFIGYIYGPQIAVTVPADAPPLFDAIALDDPIFPTMGFPIVSGWLKAQRPVELHAYGRGGHGFGLGKTGTTPTLLIEEVTAWLSMQGFLNSAASK